AAVGFEETDPRHRLPPPPPRPRRPPPPLRRAAPPPPPPRPAPAAPRAPPPSPGGVGSRGRAGLRPGDRRVRGDAAPRREHPGPDPHPAARDLRRGEGRRGPDRARPLGPAHARLGGGDGGDRRARQGAAAVTGLEVDVT